MLQEGGGSLTDSAIATVEAMLQATDAPTGKGTPSMDKLFKSLGKGSASSTTDNMDDDDDAGDD